MTASGPSRGECPRCGYDQAGAIASWGGSCPLDGVCSECGLGFAWRDLLNPRFSDRDGLAEHHWTVRCLLRTWWKAARGWSFWRWIRMEHRIVARRLVATGIAAMVLSHLLLTILTGLVHFLLPLLGPLVPAWGAIYSGRPWGVWWQTLALNAMWPLGAANKLTLIERGLVSLRTFTHPLELVAVLAAVLMPLTFALLGTTLRRARVRSAHIARVWVYGLIWLPLPLHLSGFLAGLSGLIDLGVTALFYHDGSISRVTWSLYRLDGAFTLLAVALWLSAWWMWACGRYLRLPHAAAVGALMTLLSVLGALVAVALTWQGSWMAIWM